MTQTVGIPVIKSDLIRVGIIARHPKYLYPMSYATIQRMCRSRVFKTATKLGAGKQAHWFVSRAEVLEYRASRAASQLQDV